MDALIVDYAQEVAELVAAVDDIDRRVAALREGFDADARASGYVVSHPWLECSHVRGELRAAKFFLGLIAERLPTGAP